ncbi:polysaccharide deacetylase [Saccharibacillus sp. VR-M41]|uniref:Polysaccharide deacetylase n=2 Tax=Saccharibacillus alkalitolerans TaxID=2705290 RepID=A0ABX0F7A3_9BACL|nr:polysaccharide deacetylase [Saccharibacillus alkalitolerans]
MIPASLLKSAFHFGVAYDAGVPVVRITSGKQKLSLQDFVLQNRGTEDGGRGKTEDKPQQQKPVPTKPIYLTFDDGPTAHTGELLDILDKYGARGTFFMLGPNIASYPNAVKRLVQSGNAAGLHGMTHVKSKFYASPASALKEMEQDNAALRSAAGIDTTLIRTPYGSKPYFTEAYRNKMMSAGFHLWDWNVDSEDWKYKTDHNKVIRSVLQQIETVEKQGTVPIVLMHDQPATLKVLPEVLKTLKAEGFTFEVIDGQTTPVNFWHDKR